MSEYQYYEFRAIDRPLSQKEMDELRALSTRAEITPTSFTNTYHWGDFKGSPATLMDRYFDAFVYVANWGTHRLMFHIPRRFLDAEAATAYCDGEALSLKAKKEHVVLEFSSEDESGDEWTEGEHWMPSLISLRAELMRGDTRALYLGWLASLRSHGWDDEDGRDEEDGDDDRLEPPVPPGLAKLSAPLRALAEFLRVDDELIEAAAAGSAGEPPSEPSRTELARWVKGLPAADKDAYLLASSPRKGTSCSAPSCRSGSGRRPCRRGRGPPPTPSVGRSRTCSPPAPSWSRRRTARRPSGRPESGRVANASRPSRVPSTSTAWPAASRLPGVKSKN